MEKKIIIKALELLGLALANHNHQWTKTERMIYEKAIAILEKE